MDGFLRQSTAVDILLGPFPDKTDGDTDETGLTIAQADVRLSKNGQNMAQKNDDTTCVHDELSMYNCELDATDTDTAGILVVNAHKTGALHVKQTYQVLSQASYDAIYGTTIITAKDLGLLHESTIGTVTSQIEFICDVAIVSDDNWICQTISI